MKKIFTHLSFIGILMLASCGAGKELFTQDVRERISSSGDDLVEKIQYYNDREIRLVYSSKSSSEKISGGKVKFKNGYYYYTVIIPKETPAVAKRIDSKALKVYFETGEDRYLVFRNFNKDPHYQLGGSKESGNFTVQFEGKTFVAETGGGTRLLFKKSEAVKKAENSRKVRGVKVKD